MTATSFPADENFPPELAQPPLDTSDAPSPTNRLFDELSSEAQNVLPTTADRCLPRLISESADYRWLWVAVAIGVCALYALALRTYWAPADGGIDQNAYLVGGRMMASHFTTRYELPDRFSYIGGMFDRSAKGNFYPKYPFGLPILYAICIWTCGTAHAMTTAFLVSPASTVAAVLGMFFLARLIAGSFAAVLAAILLASSQVTLELANNPNSHASCMAFIVWGMYAMIRWWQSGGLWRGILGGFLIGFAGTIRYSEGLLVLPIAVACASRLRWSDWRSYLRCAAPGFAWLLPIATLLIYNKLTLGDWTGYDSTNESKMGTAFTWSKLSATWEEMLRTLHDMGLFFVLPLGVAGLAMLFRRSWQLGFMMLAWLLPGLALYTSYYFSPDRGIAYARFFLTFFPVILVGVAVCFRDGILSGKELDAHPALSIPLDLAVGLVVAISAGVGMYRAANGMESGQSSARMDIADEYRARQNLAQIGQKVFANVPAGSVLFTQEGGIGESPINYLQFIQNWDIFSASAFSPTGGRRGLMGRGPLFGGGNTANPRPMQQALSDYFAKIYSAPDLSLPNEEKRVIDTALSSGKRVFIAASLLSIETLETNPPLRSGKYLFHRIDRWNDYPEIPIDSTADDTTAQGGPPGGGGFGGGRRGGGGGFGGGGFRGRGGGGGMDAPQTLAWALVEITAKTTHSSANVASSAVSLNR
jgi:uncharacterized membrane protein YgcG